MDLRRRALALGAANAFDFLTQFVLPVVLVRCLEPAAFAQYRLLWLAAGTILSVATLAMPASLYFFLLRSEREAQRLYINQTLLFLAAAGVIAGWIVSPWNPWIPEALRTLASHEVIVPAFLLLSVIASLLDLLPTVEERVAWQFNVTVGLAIARAVALSTAAALTHELLPVLLAMLLFVALKVVLLLVYVARNHGLRGPLLRWRAFVDQLKTATPIGAAGVFYGLRGQADQWVVATLLPLSVFASFSIAAVLAPLLNLLRQSVNAAFLPSMSRFEAAGDVGRMLRLNGRANVMVGAVAYPLLAFAFAFADEIVTIIYTPAYAAAAPVMRVYIVGLAAVVIELATITLLLRQGAFVLRLNVAALALSVAVSWYAALQFGMVGAALGSVAVMYVDRFVTLRRIGRITGTAIRHLQEWRALGVLLSSAIAAAALARWGVMHYASAASVLVRAAAGGVILAAAYGVMYRLFVASPASLSAAGKPELSR